MQHAAWLWLILSVRVEKCVCASQNRLRLPPVWVLQPAAGPEQLFVPEIVNLSSGSVTQMRELFVWKVLIDSNDSRREKVEQRLENRSKDIPMRDVFK